MSQDAEGFSVPRTPDMPRFQRGRGRISGGSRGDGISGDGPRVSQVDKPRKYIKYSLADVDDISEKSNARAGNQSTVNVRNPNTFGFQTGDHHPVPMSVRRFIDF